MYCKNCGQDVGNDVDIYCPHCKIQQGKDNYETGEYIDDNRIEELLDFHSEESLFEVRDHDKGLFDEIEEFHIEETYQEAHPQDLLEDVAISEESHDEGLTNMNKDYHEFKKSIFNRKDAFDDSYDYLNGSDEIESNSKSKLLILLIILAFLVALGLAVKFLLIDEGKLELPAFLQNILKEQQINEPDEDEGFIPEEDLEEEPLDEAEDIHSREYIFSHLSEVNQNIIEVKDNNAFINNRDTGIKDIDDSIPLQKEIYQVVDETDIYYDEAIIKALVLFNSAWNDYVNENDQTVVALVKKDSKAYKNVINFRRSNRKQEFLLFEIGEITKGQEGYYVWTHEKIRQTEKGKVSLKEYHWIYQLVEEEDELLIVNYHSM